MEKVINAFKSKRVWVIIVMFIINGVSAVSSEIPAEVMAYINPILVMLGVMFGVKSK